MRVPSAVARRWSPRRGAGDADMIGLLRDEVARKRPSSRWPPDSVRCEGSPAPRRSSPQALPPISQWPRSARRVPARSSPPLRMTTATLAPKASRRRCEHGIAQLRLHRLEVVGLVLLADREETGRTRNASRRAWRNLRRSGGGSLRRSRRVAGDSFAKRCRTSSQRTESGGHRLDGRFLATSSRRRPIMSASPAPPRRPAPSNG